MNKRNENQERCCLLDRPVCCYIFDSSLGISIVLGAANNSKKINILQVM